MNIKEHKPTTTNWCNNKTTARDNRDETKGINQVLVVMVMVAYFIGF
jgi:hypothetical protein